MLRWNAALEKDSLPALVYEVWISKLPRHVFPGELGARVDLQMLLHTLEREPHAKALGAALEEALSEIQRDLGADRKGWQWGRLHTITFRHPVMGDAAPPVPRPGDGNTVNSTSGSNFRQTNGASYRQILDVSDWDKSVMTTVPGESGDPRSPHYKDLLDDWSEGRYHPMVYSRKAVEAATIERITLGPAR
jgi:penicillin amidase